MDNRFLKRLLSFIMVFLLLFTDSSVIAMADGSSENGSAGSGFTILGNGLDLSIENAVSFNYGTKVNLAMEAETVSGASYFYVKDSHDSISTHNNNNIYPAGDYRIAYSYNNGITTVSDSSFSRYGFTIEQAKLATPSGLSWDGSDATWTALSEDCTYDVSLYKEGTDSVILTENNISGNRLDLSGALNSNGIGSYRFSVRAIPTDTVNYLTSEWSELSGVFTVETRSITSPSDLSFTYDGSLHEINVSAEGSVSRFVWYKGNSLYSTGSSISVSNVTDSGTYRVDAEYPAIGGGTDTLSGSDFQVSITPKEAGEGSDVSVSLSSDSYSYTGSAIEPSVIVTDETRGVALSQGIDYSVNYSNNISVGSAASVTVTFSGNYVGERSLSFSIDKNDLNKPIIEIEGCPGKEWEYNGGKELKTFTLTGLPDDMSPAEKANYTIYFVEGTLDSAAVDALNTGSTVQPVNAGDYTAFAIVGESEKYTGTHSLPCHFSIKPKTITLTAGSKSWDYDGNVHSFSSFTPSKDEADAQFEFSYESFNSIEVVGGITNVGSVANTVKYTLSSTTNASNYNIVCVPGTLTVNATVLQSPADLLWDTKTPGKATWVAIAKTGLTVKYKLKLYENDICIAGGSEEILVSGTSYDFADIIHERIATGTKGAKYHFTVETIPSDGINKDNYTRSLPGASEEIHTVVLNAVVPDQYSECYERFTVKNSDATSVVLLPGESVSFTAEVKEGYKLTNVAINILAGSKFLSSTLVSSSERTREVKYSVSKSELVSAFKLDPNTVTNFNVLLSLNDLEPKVTAFTVSNSDDLASVKLQGTVYDYIGLKSYRFVKVNGSGEVIDDTVAWTDFEEGSKLSKSVNMSVSESGTWALQVKDTADNTGISKGISVYEISFVGGTGATGSMPTIYKVENTSIVLPSNTFEKTRNTFKNWQGSKTGIYDDNSAFIANVNETLEALWTAEKVYYKVEYYYKDGGGDYGAAELSIEKTGDFGATIEPSEPTIQRAKPGYALDDAEGVNKPIILDGSLNQTIKLYYKPGKQKITYSYRIPGEAEDTVSVLEFDYTEAVTELTKPVVEGYDFVGWNYDEVGTAPATMPAKDLTASGVFKPKATFYYAVCHLETLGSGEDKTGIYPVEDAYTKIYNAKTGDSIIAKLSGEVESGTVIADEIKGFTLKKVSVSTGAPLGESMPDGEGITAEGTVGYIDSERLYINYYYERDVYDLSVEVWKNDLSSIENRLFVCAEKHQYGEDISALVDKYSSDEYYLDQDPYAGVLSSESKVFTMPEGFKFAYYTDYSTGDKPVTMPGTNLSIRKDVVAKENAQYKVNLYFETATIGVYELKSTLIYDAPIGAIVHVSDSDMDSVGNDYYINCNSAAKTVRNSSYYTHSVISELDANNNLSVEEGTVLEDGSMELCVYFERKSTTATISYRYRTTGSGEDKTIATYKVSGKWGTEYTFAPDLFFDPVTEDAVRNNDIFSANTLVGDISFTGDGLDIDFRNGNYLVSFAGRYDYFNANGVPAEFYPNYTFTTLGDGTVKKTGYHDRNWNSVPGITDKITGYFSIDSANYVYVNYNVVTSNEEFYLELRIRNDLAKNGEKYNLNDSSLAWWTDPLYSGATRTYPDGITCAAIVYNYSGTDYPVKVINKCAIVKGVANAAPDAVANYPAANTKGNGYDYTGVDVTDSANLKHGCVYIEPSYYFYDPEANMDKTDAFGDEACVFKIVSDDRFMQGAYTGYTIDGKELDQANAFLSAYLEAHAEDGIADYKDENCTALAIRYHSFGSEYVSGSMNYANVTFYYRDNCRLSFYFGGSVYSHDTQNSYVYGTFIPGKNIVCDSVQEKAGYDVVWYADEAYTDPIYAHKENDGKGQNKVGLMMTYNRTVYGRYEKSKVNNVEYVHYQLADPVTIDGVEYTYIDKDNLDDAISTFSAAGTPLTIVTSGSKINTGTQFDPVVTDEIVEYRLNGEPVLKVIQRQTETFSIVELYKGESGTDNPYEAPSGFFYDESNLKNQSYGSVNTVPLILEVYFARDKYSVEVDDKTGDNSVIKAFSLGQKVLLADPVKPGYTFTGWTWTKNESAYDPSYEEGESYFRMPAYNLKAVASYSPASFEQAVVHKYQDVDGIYKENSEKETAINVTSEAAFPEDPADVNSLAYADTVTHTYIYTLVKDTKGVVTRYDRDTIEKPVAEYGMTVEVYYKLTQEFNVSVTGRATDGGESGLLFTGEGSYPIGESAKLSATVSEGYTFVGWFDGSDTEYSNPLCTDTVYEISNIIADHSLVALVAPAGIVEPNIRFTQNGNNISGDNKINFTYGYGDDSNRNTIITIAELEKTGEAAKTKITGYKWYQIDENESAIEPVLSTDNSWHFPTGMNAGTYTYRCEVYFERTDTARTGSKYKDLTIIVDKADMNPQLVPYAGVFDNKPHSIKVNMSRLANEYEIYYHATEEITPENKDTLTLSDTVPTYTHVLDYYEDDGYLIVDNHTTYIYIHDLTGNYNDYYGDSTVWIKPKEIDIKATDKIFEKMYDGNENIDGNALEEGSNLFRLSQGGYYTVEGYVTGDANTEAYTLNCMATFNDYHVRTAKAFTVKNIYFINKNTGDYSYDYVYPVDKTLRFSGNITPRPLDAEWVYTDITVVDGDTLPVFIYNGTEQGPDVSLCDTQQYTIPDSDKDDLTGSLSSSGRQINAGIYTAMPIVTVHGGEHYESSDYTFKLSGQKYVISKRHVTVRPETTEVTYNGQKQTISAFTISPIEDIPEAERKTITASPVRSYVNAGVYIDMLMKDLTVLDSKGRNKNDNYDVEYLNGTLTINKCPVTVTGIKINGKKYDGTTSVALGDIDISAVSFVPEGGSSLFTNALTKTKDVLTLNIPTIGAYYLDSAVGDGKTVNITLRTESVINSGTATCLTNYTFDYENSQKTATSSIFKNSVKVKAEPLSVIYGEDAGFDAVLQGFYDDNSGVAVSHTVSEAGLIGIGTLSYKINTGTAESPVWSDYTAGTTTVGTYEIKVDTSGLSHSDYNFVWDRDADYSVLTVLKRPVRIMASDNPDITKTYDGTKNAQGLITKTEDYVFSAASGSGLNAAGVIPSDEASFDLNSFIAQYNSKDVVDADKVTIDNLVLKNTNYKLVKEDGSNWISTDGLDIPASIERKDLTLTIAEKTIEYGIGVPSGYVYSGTPSDSEYLITLTGFITGETTSALNGDFVILNEYDTTTASARHAGDYDVTLEVHDSFVNDNYRIMANGTELSSAGNSVLYSDLLHVTKKNLIVIPNDKIMKYKIGEVDAEGHETGLTVPVFDWRYEGFVSWDNETVLASELSGISSYVVTKDASPIEFVPRINDKIGEYDIKLRHTSAALPELDNYNVEFRDGLLTIIPSKIFISTGILNELIEIDSKVYDGTSDILDGQIRVKTTAREELIKELAGEGDHTKDEYSKLLADDAEYLRNHPTETIISFVFDDSHYNDKNVGTSKEVYAKYILGDYLKERYEIDESSDKKAYADITKAPLSITPIEKEITYGSAKPASSTYDYSITGLVNSETVEGTRGVNDFNGNLSYECSDYSDTIGSYSAVNTVSGAGYDVIVSGVTNNNYDITFNAGKLKVKQTQLSMAVPVWSSESASLITWAATPAIGDVNVAKYVITLIKDGADIETQELAGNVTSHDFADRMQGNFGSYSVRIQAIASLENNAANVNVLDSEVKNSANRTAITITGADASKTYDGTPLSFEQANIGNGEGFSHSALLSGDSIAELTLTGSITNYDGGDNGSNHVKNMPSSVKIINDQSEDVTSEYFVSYVPGTLTINKRNITLKADDKLASAGLGSTFGAVPSEMTVSVTAGVDLTLSASDIITELSATAVGETETISSSLASGIYSIKVIYEDIHGNYNISTINGQYEISPADMVVTGSALETVYDGLEHTIALNIDTVNARVPVIYYSESELTNSNYLTLGSTERPAYVNVKITAGAVDEYKVYYYIVCDDHNDASGYDTVKILKRPVSFTAKDAEKEYDGTALTCNVTTGTEPDYSVTLTETDKGIAETDFVDDISISGEQTDVGHSDNVPSSAVIRNNTSLTDVTANYEITYVNGTLTVTKAKDHLEITEDPGRVYDGLASVLPAFSRMRNGETSDNTAVVSYKIYDADGQELAEMPVDAGNYSIKVYEAETDNYQASESLPFDFVISKRPVTITSDGGEWTYDTLVHSKKITEGSDKNYSITPADSVSGLLSGHVLGSISLTAEIKAAGEKENIISDVSIVKETDPSADVTSNYEIICDNGILKINKAKDVIEDLVIIEKMEDGTAATVSECSRHREGSIDTDNTAEIKFEYYSDKNGAPGTKLSKAPVNAGKYWIRAFEDESLNYLPAFSEYVAFEITQDPNKPATKPAGGGGGGGGAYPGGGHYDPAPNPGKPSEEEPAKEEPTQNEPSKNEPSKNEPAKNEPSKNEPAKNEPSATVPSIPVNNTPGTSQDTPKEPDNGQVISGHQTVEDSQNAGTGKSAGHSASIPENGGLQPVLPETEKAEDEVDTKGSVSAEPVDKKQGDDHSDLDYYGRLTVISKSARESGADSSFENRMEDLSGDTPKTPNYMTATFSNKKTAAKAILSEEEWQLLDEGNHIAIRLTIDDEQKTKEDKALKQFKKDILKDSRVKADMEKMLTADNDRVVKVKSFVYLELEKKINDGTWERIIKSDDPIEIKIDIPAKMHEIGGLIYIAVRKGDEFILLEDLDDDPDTITVRTDDFESDYLLIAIEEEGTPAALLENYDEEKRCIWHWLVFAMMLLSTGIALFYWKEDEENGKKRRKGHVPVLVIINVAGVVFTVLGICRLDLPVELLGVLVSLTAEYLTSKEAKDDKRRNEENNMPAD